MISMVAGQVASRQCDTLVFVQSLDVLGSLVKSKHAYWQIHGSHGILKSFIQASHSSFGNIS